MKGGIASLELMLSAGRGAFSVICDKIKKSDIVKIAIGNGNNGGDGFVIALCLLEKGYKVKAVCFSSEYSVESRIYATDFINKGGVIERYTKGIFRGATVIIDCIFGIGLSREVEGIYCEAINEINSLKLTRIAIDIPSGLNADNGRVQGIAVVCDMTVTIGALKYGLFLNDAKDYVGELFVVNLGFPEIDSGYLIDDEYAATAFGKRKKNVHKRTIRIVNIETTASNMAGAPYLTAIGASAFATGVGLVRLIAEKSIIDRIPASVPEILFAEARNEDYYTDNVVCFGMGAGKSEETGQRLNNLLNMKLFGLVLDADALYYTQSISKRNSVFPIIHTPHPKEAAAMAGCTTDEILSDPIGRAQQIVKQLGDNTVLVLKGCSTIITDGKSILVDASGSPVMSKGGSGDVLSGIVAGLMARGFDPLFCAGVGHYISGKAGELAAAEVNEYSPTPSQIANYVPKVVTALCNKSK